MGVITGIIDWFIEFARISWDLFCMIPFTCILILAVILVGIPVWKATWKRIDEAKGPIILR